jgi:hypothetical protein
MSLAKSNLMSVTRKQYGFKLQTFSKFFIVIIVTQILGMFFAISNAGGQSSTSTGMYTFNIDINSTTPILIFTIACIIGATILLNIKEYKDMDFTFVSNRFSSNLSNIAFLITITLFGAVTSALSGAVIRVIKYLLIGSSNIVETGFFITPIQLMCSIGATFLYILLFIAVVYFSSVLIQKSNIFIVVILAVAVLLPRTSLFKTIIEFYGNELSFFMFMIKVISTCIVFFTFSIFLSNDLEVRR